MKKWKAAVAVWSVALVMAGCTGSGIEKISKDEKQMLEQRIEENIGKKPREFQSIGIADWAPEGWAMIQEMSDDVLESLEPYGIGIAHSPVYTKIQYEKMNVYVQMGIEDPEDLVLLEIGEQLYVAKGDKKAVQRLIDWMEIQNVDPAPKILPKS